MGWGGYNITFAKSIGSGIRVTLAVRQNRRQFCKNTFFANTRQVVPRGCALHLSALSGSGFLNFHDTWLRWGKRQAKLNPSAKDDDDEESASLCTWIASSPALQQNSSILDHIIRWLRTCWKKISKFSAVARRISEVIIYLSPLMILGPAGILSTRVFNSPVFSNLAWNYTISAIQGLGPVAVKFCQWAATRRDIFPPALCDNLSILHDKGYPHPWRWTSKVLTEAFGDYEGKGLVIEDVIGCGAAAQVYRGKITADEDSVTSENSLSTRDVAIKVLHPQFQELVDRDLDFIDTMAGFLHSLPITYLKMLNLPRAVEEFSVVLRDQADLTIEAENLRQFGRNFYKDSHKTKEGSTIIFPQPIDGWTSSSVIVEEYIKDAVPIVNFLSNSSGEGMDTRKEIAGPLLRAFLKMVFMDNFIHGDLHPVRVYKYESEEHCASCRTP